MAVIDRVPDPPHTRLVDIGMVILLEMPVIKGPFFDVLVHLMLHISYMPL